MCAGIVYGIALNDRHHLDQLGSALSEKPYLSPPQSPVLYIKPRTCRTTGSAPIPIPNTLVAVEVAATVALLFGDGPNVPVGAALALDVSEPHESLYRPAIVQRCRDGFLPMGAFGGLPATDVEIETHIDGREAHRWSLDRLVRAIPTLIADITAFMTLEDGDMLLIGLPGDAPLARVGQRVRVTGAGLPPLSTLLEQAS